MKRNGMRFLAVLAIVTVFGALITFLMHNSSMAGQSDHPIHPTPLPTQEPVATPTPLPSIPKEEVQAMRETVLESMSEEDATALSTLIKRASTNIEQKKLRENYFKILSDPDSLSWQSFEKSGDLEFGLEYRGSAAEQKRIMKEENLTEEAFLEKYGTTQTVYNPYSGEDFAQMLLDRQKTVQNEALRQDLQTVIDEVRLAAETHDVSHVIAMYNVLHDLDYFLLNYRLDTEGAYIVDKSTVGQYFGTLAVYGDA